jgi:hypothetical protein
MELLPRVAEIGFWQTWHSRRAAFLARSMARRFWSLFQSSCGAFRTAPAPTAGWRAQPGGEVVTVPTGPLIGVRDLGGRDG